MEVLRLVLSLDCAGLVVEIRDGVRDVLGDGRERGPVEAFFSFGGGDDDGGGAGW